MHLSSAWCVCVCVCVQTYFTEQLIDLSSQGMEVRIVAILLQLCLDHGHGLVVVLQLQQAADSGGKTTAEDLSSMLHCMWSACVQRSGLGMRPDLSMGMGLHNHIWDQETSATT